MGSSHRVHAVAAALCALVGSAGCQPASPEGSAAVALVTGGETEPPDDLHGEGVVEPSIVVDMPAVPAHGTAVLEDGILPFEITNRSDTEVRARVAGRVIAEGAGHGIDLGEVVLPPGRAVPLRLRTDDAVRVDYRALRSPARVAIVVEIPSTTGMRAISDEVFVHEERSASGSSVRIAYRDDERLRTYAGGDLSVRPGTSAPPGRLDWSYQGPGVDGGGGSGELTFCLKYKVDVVDYGIGEDHHQHGDLWVFYPGYLIASGLWTAHGARYRVYDPATDAWSEGFADVETGCFSLESTATTGFVIQVFAETQLAGNNRIHGYESHEAWEVDAPAPYWEIAADPGASSGTHVYFTPPSSLSSLMGVAAWTLSDEELRLVADVCFGDLEEYGSCASGSSIWVQPSNDDRKFLVSHEVGHFVERQWGAFSPGGASYVYDNPHPACAFDDVGLHAMRSREEATLSFREGMAHFLSLLAYNDLDDGDAVFQYYKHYQPPAPLESYAYDLIDVAADGPAPAGGDVAWNDAECEAHLSPEEGYSVEQDWLRFLWDYLTDPGAAPDFPLFVAQVEAFYASAVGQLDPYNAYSLFTESLAGSGYEDRWTSLADAHSVEYPE
jgi:hypothetical protein